ncbi:DsbA family protein [Lachnospiraceae bacterium 62-35]
MNHDLKVYFDYTCPYCYRGMLDLLDLLPRFPELGIEWRPCEAHPFPEPWMHSDVASQAMMFVRDYGGNVLQFHEKVFEACFKKKKRIDDRKLMAEIGSECGIDKQELLLALEEERYAGAVKGNNAQAWNTLGFEAVPSYQYGKSFLLSHEDVMISKARLEEFLLKAKKEA